MEIYTQQENLTEEKIFRYYLLNSLSNISTTLSSIGQSINNIGLILEKDSDEEEEEEEVEGESKEDKEEAEEKEEEK